MKRVNLNDSQRKVYDACRNGWFVGGDYRAIIDNHERHFFADSIGWLYQEVNEWFESHSESHGDSALVVKSLG